jgi:hypothetical protein
VIALIEHGNSLADGVDGFSLTQDIFALKLMLRGNLDVDFVLPRATIY